MKTAALTIACTLLMVFSGAPSGTQPEDWENPAILHSGTQALRASFVPFPDAAPVHPQYTLPAKDTTFVLTLRPLRPGDDPAVKAER